MSSTYKHRDSLVFLLAVHFVQFFVETSEQGVLLDDLRILWRQEFANGRFAALLVHEEENLGADFAHTRVRVHQTGEGELACLRLRQTSAETMNYLTSTSCLKGRNRDDGYYSVLLGAFKISTAA